MKASAGKNAGREGWLAPAVFELHSTERGQATLPNPEITPLIS
ncbi:MAG: hypothetical protein QOF62_3598 [Pyrinomonadaceae bacterium]|jgi:hypothetical protein|nr:hypothetical protein [Pyrinomonadaceae bacterium]